MYKLLIVDDEPLIQAGLQSMIEWEKIDIEVIGTAANGYQALKIIKKEHPDIVITDIKMPVLSGIDLIKRCREEVEQEPQFIVLTSYEEFNLLRQAVKYNTVDYLIKLELTPEVLISSIKKAKELVAGSRISRKPSDVLTMTKIFKEGFFIKLLNRVFMSENDMNQEKLLSGVELIGDKYHSALCLIKYVKDKNLSSDEKKKILISSVQIIREIAGRSISIFLLPLDFDHFVIVIGSECNTGHNTSDEEALGLILKNSIELAEKYYNVRIFCGIGSLYNKLYSVSKSYNEAQTALTLTSDKTPFVFFSKVPKSENNNMSYIFRFNQETLRTALKCFDVVLLEQVMDQLIIKLESEDSLFSTSLDICSSFIHELLTYVTNAENILAEIFENEKNGYHCLYETTTVSQTISWILKIKKRLILEFRQKRVGYTEVLSDQVQKYIDRHYLEKIELKDIGLHFKMSPNYLCSIFRKYHSQGISSYQNSKRIDKAKDLLRQNVYKIYEISEMTGFDSPYYFSKVFKKTTGHSPRSWLCINEIVI